MYSHTKIKKKKLAHQQQTITSSTRWGWSINPHHTIHKYSIVICL